MTTALVTGATAGIGRAFVERLARDGHDLVLVARTEDRLQRVAEEVADAHGVGTEVLVADLADRGQRGAVEERLRSTDAPVGLLVNNAGFGINRPFLATDVEAEQQALDVMVVAVMRLTHAAGGAMKERGHGAIVNVASVAAFAPLNTYSAHKAWVTTFSRSIASELARHGVRVMSLNPGFVRTEFHERSRMSTAEIPDFMWLDADAMVAEAMRDLARGRDLSVPDLRYKALSTLMRATPDAIVGRIGRAMRHRQRR